MSRHSPIVVLFFAVLAVLVCSLGSGCVDAHRERDNACTLCADGTITCGEPSSCLGGTQPLPVCGVIPGYSVQADYCGGKTINGLRCTTHCAWVLGADASAEILDAGQITIPPGCTLQPGVCVTSCSDCQ